MREESDIQIRSFRVCFQLERRLHRIDRFRLPFPYGLPLRGLGYGAMILLAVLVAGALPLLGDLVRLITPTIRFGVLPIAGGYLMTELKIDGRHGHAVVGSWLRLRLGRRRVRGFRAHREPSSFLLEPIAVAPDERGAHLRRGRIDGAGRIFLRQPARLDVSGQTLRVRPEDAPPRRRGTQIDLRPGQRVVIA
ncbi:MAG TPA: hypothetical protein VLK58_01620 [Conexibacter sp.]|nr:hypothetical protein [Conexibacter sp.]